MFDCSACFSESHLIVMKSFAGTVLFAQPPGLVRVQTHSLWQPATNHKHTVKLARKGIACCSLDAEHPPTGAARHPRVAIDYCTGCRWGLRAGWMAQELLITFERELGEVALRPGTRSGVFDVWVDSERVWCREEMRRFPELKELKQIVRNAVAPDRLLGHSDKK